jgi:hypothetical protein
MKKCKKCTFSPKSTWERIKEWYKGPVNPIFLTIQDPILHKDFLEQSRLITRNRIKYAAIIINIYYLVYILLNIKDLKSKLWYLAQFGELVVSIDLLYLISRCKLAYIDFCML